MGRGERFLITLLSFPPPSYCEFSHEGCVADGVEERCFLNGAYGRTSEAPSLCLFNNLYYVIPFPSVPCVDGLRLSKGRIVGGSEVPGEGVGSD